ncbi:hypothetical protein JKG47_15230 [Acidithiobacillus sp. MC6.1]|nr:hypothetical protein [Acidithiobacillus sp. MC6.1]
MAGGTKAAFAGAIKKTGFDPLLPVALLMRTTASQRKRSFKFGVEMCSINPQDQI